VALAARASASHQIPCWGPQKAPKKEKEGKKEGKKEREPEFVFI
jgi:hypothetical protein